jgi:outer membrane murein-binding lipoprotein Lpp
MSRTAKFGGLLFTATALASGLLASHPASAQDAAKLEAIQQQIQALQAELKRIRGEMAQRDAQVKAAREEAAKAREDAAQAAAAKPAPAPAAAATAAATPGPVLTFGTQGPPPSMQGVSPPVVSGTTVDRPNPTFQLGGVRVTLGGFIDVTGLWRSANEFRGLSTGFNSIPFNNDPNAHLSEFRASAQATRLSMLVQGNINSQSTIAGYVEGDFNNCAGGCNSVQSNSYTPRLRQGYAQYDNSAWGLHVLAGQAWSLITPFTVGITPRKENVPLVIDTQYLPGFSWTRNAQLRVAKDFENKYWIAASLESPQAVFTNVTTPLPAGTPNAGDTVTFQARAMAG